MLCPSKNLCTAHIEIMAEVTFCKTKNGTCVGRQYITDRTAFTDTVVAYESLPARASEQGNVIGLVSMYIISYFTSKSGIWLVISRVVSYFHEPEASANTAYE